MPEIAMLKIYKIRKKGTTDLFSSGGSNPRWTKKGKTWGSMSHVTSHLGHQEDLAKNHQSRWQRYNGYANYADAEVVVFNVVEDDVLDIALIQKQIKDRKDAKAAKAEAERTKRKEEQERAQLSALQKKYPTIAV